MISLDERRRTHSSRLRPECSCVLRRGGRRPWLEVGVGIPQPGQVRGSGPGVQLTKQIVIARLSFELRDLARGVGEVAEDDRLGWAGLRRPE